MADDLNHTGGDDLKLVYRQDDDGRDKVDRALDKLKEDGDKPGAREVTVTYFNKRYRVKPRQSWDWDT